MPPFASVTAYRSEYPGGVSSAACAAKNSLASLGDQTTLPAVVGDSARRLGAPGLAASTTQSVSDGPRSLTLFSGLVTATRRSPRCDHTTSFTSGAIAIGVSFADAKLNR